MGTGNYVQIFSCNGDLGEGMLYNRWIDKRTDRNIELKFRLFDKAADVAAARRSLFLTSSKACSMRAIAASQGPPCLLAVFVTFSILRGANDARVRLKVMMTV
jgi:hypothetical protein